MSDDSSLVARIRERLEAGDVELPVLDHVAVQVHAAARTGGSDADAISEILMQDPILVSNVLRLANSSFFAGLAEVRSLRDATVRLGTRRIASLVMSVSQKRLYSASKGPFRARLLQLWRHSSAVATGSRWLAVHAGYRDVAEEAFVAGLLHDVGKLSLLRIIEDLALGDRLSLTNDLVDSVLDQLACDHGARLLELWSLPALFVELLRRLEDEPNESDLLRVMVRLADRACALEGVSDRPDPLMSLESLRETHILGLDEVELAELRLTIEDFESSRNAA